MEKAVPVSVGGLTPLAKLLGNNWRRVALTCAIFNIENLVNLAQPFVLGRAINGLLKGEYAALLLLVGQHLSHLLISTTRRMYDTRAFTAVYTETATSLVSRQRDARLDVSTVAARSALSRELVEFFEHDLKGVFAFVYGLIGA